MTTTTTELMVQMDQAEFRNLIKKSYCKNTTDLEFMLFIEQCKNLKLNPMAGQISMIKIWDTTVNSEVAIAVVRIDGFRSIAHRTGQFAGRIGPEWCGDDGVWKDIWLSNKPPAAARVGILRKDCQNAIWGTALYKSYCRFRKKDGAPMAMWATMPEVMLAKCAEAQALRSSFPIDLGGAYSHEEMDQANSEYVQVVPEDNTLKLNEPKVWEPTKASLKILQSEIEKTGVPLTPENKPIFVQAKEMLIGTPLDEVEQKTLEIIDILCFNEKGVAPTNDKSSATETTTQA